MLYSVVMDKSQPDRNTLRQQAEAIFTDKSAANLTYDEPASPDSSRRLLHELQVHQIELELQNEELRQAQVALDLERTKYFDLYDLAPVGYVTLSDQGLILQANLTAAKQLGVPRSELLHRPISRFILDKDQDSFYLLRQQLLATDAPQVTELQMIKHDGTPMWAQLTAEVLRCQQEAVLRVIISDITQRHLDMDEVQRLAFFDPLTGLPNRRLLQDRLRQAMLTSIRTKQHGALMFLDLDHFKRINDTLNHELGDLLLQQVATRLLACVREGDSVARLGGDEFVVLLETLSDHDHEAAVQAEDMAHKILLALEQTYNLNGQAYDSTISIGIVVFLADHDTLDELLKKADVAMYQAKADGRNTARFFDPVIQAAVTAQSELQTDLHRGLAQKEFVLHYQIQVNHQGEPIGAEALVRWNHPTRGMVSPAHFIPLAEETGLILPLGQWVLETACAQLVKWAEDPQTASWKMAVNVSALQFSKVNFSATVVNALENTGANPRRLKLELTESMLINDVEDVIRKMNAIKSLGVSFALDDFGTGYSSLSYLKRLPLAQLKIDQSFVRDLQSNTNDTLIAKTIVALGHSLGLNVIAEGVETAAQRDYLASIGCDAFQGYFFGRPMPASELLNFALPMKMS